MSANRYSYNMHQPDKGSRKSKTNHKSSGGGGDYTLDWRGTKNNGVFLEEPTFSDDPVEWNKADYKYNIRFLKKYITNQKRYLKQEEENFARNNELIANMKSSQQMTNNECIRKKSEIQKKENEIEDFKTQIRKNVETNNNIRSQLLCEQEVNRDVKKQIKRLTKRRELLLKKQTEEGISDDIIEAYESAKELLESEKERKERLVKKDNWYTTEIATIREVLANEDGNTKLDGIEIEKVSQDEEQDNCTSNNNIKHFLPKINKIRACGMSPEPLQEESFNMQRQNVHEQISKLPPISNACEYSSCQATYLTKHGGVNHMPNIENKDGLSSCLSASFPSKHVYPHVTHPPKIPDSHGQCPRPRTPGVRNGRIPHGQAIASTPANVPHSPRAVPTQEIIPHPPSGKKEGAFRRFYRKLKSVIK